MRTLLVHIDIPLLGRPVSIRCPPSTLFGHKGNHNECYWPVVQTYFICMFIIIITIWWPLGGHLDGDMFACNPARLWFAEIWMWRFFCLRPRPWAAVDKLIEYWPLLNSVCTNEWIHHHFYALRSRLLFAGHALAHSWALLWNWSVCPLWILHTESKWFSCFSCVFRV